MFVFGCIKWHEIDDMLLMESKSWGLIFAIIALVAAGYGTAYLRNRSGCRTYQCFDRYGRRKYSGAFAMLIVGLLITMGIGTLRTHSRVATIYVPMCIQLGFSVQSTVILLAAAAALGDAGSPASDTTLGPTSGLNADGQHEHIWDTCVPTFPFQCSFDYWSYDWFYYDLRIEFKYHLDCNIRRKF